MPHTPAVLLLLQIFVFAKLARENARGTKRDELYAAVLIHRPLAVPDAADLCRAALLRIPAFGKPHERNLTALNRMNCPRRPCSIVRSLYWMPHTIIVPLPVLIPHSPIVFFLENRYSVRMKIERNKLLPFVLTLAVIIADQISKALIIKHIPPLTVGAQFFGDLLRIVHVSNTGVAFSLGDSMPLLMRRLLFALAPLGVIFLVIGVYFRNNDFSPLQRWAICGIVGGGFGNLIDRFFRSSGVIDFIDVKFFGIFGLARWPTFNIADAAVVVCGLLLLLSFLLAVQKEKNNAHTGEGTKLPSES